MSKRRRRNSGNPQNKHNTTRTTESAASPIKPATGRLEVDSHHGTHRGLIANAGNILQADGKETAFSYIKLFGESPNRLLLAYRAASQLVAIRVQQEADGTCWNFRAYSRAGGSVDPVILQSTDLEAESSWIKRISIHAKLTRNTDTNRVAENGAAAALVSMQRDIGIVSLPEMTFAGYEDVLNGSKKIRARLFAPENCGPAVTVAVTHLRNDTSSILAFHGSNTDNVSAALGHHSMIPGEAGCHPSLPEFIDLSMHRTGPSIEKYVGELMARSLCALTANAA